MDDLPLPQILIAAAILFGVFLLGRTSVRRRKQPRNPIRESRSSIVEHDHGARVTRTSGNPQEMVESLSSSEREVVESFVQSGKKINAIKEMRMFTGSGLKEAKEAVEWMEEQM